MTALIFQDWILKFVKMLKSLGHKKVSLVLDNAPDHLAALVIDQLEVVKLLFLPPNTTASFQPMDQGIISSFKAQYCRLMIKKQLHEFEANKSMTIDIYNVVTLFVLA